MASDPDTAAVAQRFDVPRGARLWAGGIALALALLTLAALEKHAAALRARYQLDVETTLGDEPDVPLLLKEALYRIAQEALHNTVKHAQARRVWLRLAEDGGAVVLEARDDGIGFDTGGHVPGHLGLKSMRERIERLGRRLEVESAPGRGTRIRAQTPPGVAAPARGVGQEAAP